MISGTANVASPDPDSATAKAKPRALSNVRAITVVQISAEMPLCAKPMIAQPRYQVQICEVAWPSTTNPIENSSAAQMTIRLAPNLGRISATIGMPMNSSTVLRVMPAEISSRLQPNASLSGLIIVPIAAVCSAIIVIPSTPAATIGQPLLHSRDAEPVMHSHPYSLTSWG